MVREGKSIQQVASELQLDLLSRELENIQRTKGFQEVLWAERHKYHKQLAADPNASKQSLLGQMMYSIQKLIEEGEHAKALTGMIQLAKVAGYVGDGGQVNIFAGLKEKDLKKLEAQVAKATEEDVELPADAN